MTKKILFFVGLFFFMTAVSAFVMAESDLNDLSDQLEKARQQTLDQDLDQLEESLSEDEDPFLKETKEEAKKEEEAKPEPTPEPEPQPEPKPVHPVAQEPPAPDLKNAKVKLKEPSLKESPQHFALTLMGGTYRPGPAYVGAGDSFASIYKGKNWFLDSAGLWTEIGLEWQFIKSVGKLGIKGLTGTWLIKSRHDPTSDTETSEKSYTLFAVPAFIGGVYRAHYWKNQLIVPFVEGFYGNFRLQQTDGVNRDRYTVNRQGTMWGGGIQINGNVLDPSAGRSFDINWGVNRTYFFASYRNIQSSQQDEFDFSGSELVTGGLLFEF